EACKPYQRDLPRLAGQGRSEHDDQPDPPPHRVTFPHTGAAYESADPPGRDLLGVAKACAKAVAELDVIGNRAQARLLDLDPLPFEDRCECRPVIPRLTRLNQGRPRTDRFPRSLPASRSEDI